MSIRGPLLRRLRILTSAATLAASPFVLAGCIVPSPSPGTWGELRAVSALSKSNAWAVGVWADAHGAHDLVEHWDGASWSVAALPFRPGGGGLSDVTAISASNVWAVGGGRTLHYDGRSWHSSPDAAGLFLSTVAAGRDGAVRAIAYSTTQKPLVLQWMGSGWRVMATPTVPGSLGACDGNLGLANLTVLNAHDIWVAGNVNGSGPNAMKCAYAAHWNGAQWKAVPTPTLPYNATLTSISARTPSDVWAVGYSTTTLASTGRAVFKSIALRWNGSRWRSLPSMDSSGEGDLLFDVDATSAGVWAVGSAPLIGGLLSSMVIKKWSGTRFVDQPVQSIEQADDPGATYMSLSGVAVRDGVVVSVGTYEPTSRGSATLADRRNAV